MKPSNESGIALISALLITLLMAAVLVGFTALVASDNRLRGLDASRSNAFYAAHAGLEKLTSDLGNLFTIDFSPSAAQVAAVEAALPVLPNVAFTAADGLAYDITYLADADGNPTTENHTILSGPYQGFIGLATPYTLTVTARTVDGSEARLQRSLQTVSIPVFQFGVFSDTDLTFSANGTFSFGGRVHTNGTLWLAAASGGTLTLSDKVTALSEVVRSHLSNGRAVTLNNSHDGTVRMIQSPGLYRNLARTEGSLTGFPPSAQNEPTWTNLSTGTYNSNITNGRTGARRLDLPLITIGATPIDLIRRPVVGENALITGQRMYARASIRILLSDTAAAISSLPGVSAAAPVSLGRLADTPIPGYVVGIDNAPLAVSTGLGADGYRSDANTPLHGGFLKIEYRDNADNWNDVTLEWLNLGFTRRNIDSATCAGAEPSPNGILRIQRVKDNPASGPSCAVDSVLDTDYWPLALYDIRESWSRDNLGTASSTLYLNGVMHYVDFDVNNLRRWLAGQVPGSGTQVLSDNGYVVYFSDRRNNRDLAGNETGEYGSEDIVNPNDAATAAPNGVLDTGEDVNANGVLDTYGATPVLPAGFGVTAPLDGTATPRTALNNGAGNDSAMNKARVNRAILFRRALKVTNGVLGNLPAAGLTVVAENPVYVEGHYNANAAGFGAGSAAASIMGDAITLLSANWWDTSSFQSPANPANRASAAVTSYRFAAIAGKISSFGWINGTPASYGTDGGAHNFLRLIEAWNSRRVNYRGSIASLYFSRQALGLFRCCTNVYELPSTRDFAFDVNFLDPNLLPPATPLFRDVNSLGFTWVIRPR